MFNNEVAPGYLKLNEQPESQDNSYFESPDSTQFLPLSVKVVEDNNYYIITVCDAQGKSQFARIRREIHDSTEAIADQLAA